MVQIPVNGFENKIFNLKKLPVLLYAGQISDEPDWVFPSHKHDNLSEIIYISEGEGTFIIDDIFYSAKQGDLLIYNKGVVHDEKSNPKNPLKTYFCGIGDLDIEGVEQGCIIPSNIVPVINVDKYKCKIENYISDIFDECNSQIIGYETICQNLVVSLIVFIHRIINTDYNIRLSKKISPLSNQIKGYIDKKYTSDISLKEIANNLYISQDYLSHVFKSETGYSPINYMINRRMGEARKLLLTTNMTVQQISKKVGYENTNYFSNLFKKINGFSPSGFREESKKHKD